MLKSCHSDGRIDSAGPSKEYGRRDQYEGKGLKGRLIDREAETTLWLHPAQSQSVRPPGRHGRLCRRSLSRSGSCSSYAPCLLPPLPSPRHPILPRIMATRQLRPAEGSRTITVQDNQPREEESQSEAESSAVGTLRLRGAPRNRPRVVWREDVVDNEGAGKKKSKSAYRATLPHMVRPDTFCRPYSLLHLPQATAVRRVFFRRVVGR